MSNSIAQISLAVFLLIVFMFLNGFGLLSKIMDYGRLATNFVITPLVAVLETAADFGDTVASIRKLAVQNSFLEKQVSELTLQAALLEKDAQENKILREALGFQTESKLKLIPVEVISLDEFNLDQKATLNRGQANGLAVGDSVVVAGGILVGTLTEVFEQTSQMQLITSSDTAINARTANGKATGIVRGEHGLGLLLDQVAQTETLEAGDKVMSSGLGGKYSSNLYIGKIGEVHTKSSSLFQNASVIPAVDLRNLSILFVLKSSP